MIDYQTKETILKVSDLNLNYGNTKVLSNVNFEIKNLSHADAEQGQIVSFIGLSGIGKTQLLRTISGLNQKSSGSILLSRYNNINTLLPVVSGDIGFVFQWYPLLYHRTIYENLKITTNTNKQLQIEDFLNRVGMYEKRNLYPHQLSGGQKQRIAIIQQLLCGAEIVILDEPFSGLDIVSKNSVIKLLLNLSTINERTTFILTSHDIESAVKISDHLYVLDKDDQSSGATIVKKYDLISRGIAWIPDVEKTEKFRIVIEEINDYFLK